MYKRFCSGVQKLVNWYMMVEYFIEMVMKFVFQFVRRGLDGIDFEDDDVEMEVVVIMVFYGVGCNVLIGVIIYQFVFMDVGMVFLIMVVWKFEVYDVDIINVNDLLFVYQLYDFKLFVNSDYIRLLFIIFNFF